MGKALVFNAYTDEMDYVANVEDGTAAGQLAFWDGSDWTPAETSELVWDDTNKRLGIDVAAPGASLHVYDGASGGTPNASSNMVIEDDGVLVLQFLTPANRTQTIMFGDPVATNAGFIIYRHTQDRMEFATGTGSRMAIDSSGNIGFSTTTFGTSAAGTIGFPNGTAPSADVANQHAYYGADFAAGNACPYFRTENGTVIGLNQSLLTTDSFTFAGGTMNGDLAMGGSYQVTGLQAPAAAGEAIRQTAKITEAKMEAADDHVGGDGSDHADVATNSTHTAGDGSDHADVATNTAASHAESHSVASHNDTTATGTELETLTDTSDADSLHTHALKANIAGPTFTGAVTIPTVNLTGGQVAFPASQSASADANTLDDYEEGTWEVTVTPATSGTVTMHSSYKTGAYTKIGRIVTVQGQIKIDSISSPVGDIRFSLPFTVANTTQLSGYSAGALAIAFCDYTASYLTLSLTEGDAYFRIWEVIDAANWDYLEGGDLAAGENFAFQVTYTAA